MKKIIISLIVLNFLASCSSGESLVKKPNVSGQFYSANPKELSATIQRYLDSAKTQPSNEKISVIMAPHAGYIYSGPVAAYSYKAVSQQKVKTVIILASSHFYNFKGISVWKEGFFETPLGQIEVDQDFTKRLLAFSDQFNFYSYVFDREHSLEVQLPFLQTVFTDFKIVPIIMGQPNYQTAEILADALVEIIGHRDDVLIVVSTDMSHYKNDATARTMDQNALNAVEKLDVQGLWSQCLSRKMEMCGFTSVATALLYAKKVGLDGVKILHTANSGNVTGDLSNVVGYSSVVFFQKNQDKEKGTSEKMKQNENHKAVAVAPLTAPQKKRLLEIAQTTIDQYVRSGEIPEIKEADSRLLLEEGAFVTIHKKGQLRGCIGHIIGNGPLTLTVRDMAIAAATQDPRFPRLQESELKDIDLEISVLSKPWRMASINEFQAGVHGAIVRRGFHQGVFLPQVATETGWGKEEFLSNLCTHKAGLPADAWKDPRTTVEIFTADVFSEKDLK
ncbi:MAG: AmmeMemoRadiSam system protein B [Candidatus Omnitrophota bacterium]